MALIHSFRVQGGIAGVVVAVVFLLYLSSSRHSLASPLHFPHRAGSRDLLDDVLNTTLGFEKIYAIALPSRTDRLDAIALAAAFTDLKIEMVDGVTEVNEKSLPPDAAAAKHLKGEIGVWRAHMNVLRSIVNNNISSALLLEADADWDLRIHSQMHTFARASRMLLQPRSGGGASFLDPTYPQAEAGDAIMNFPLTDGLVEEPRTSPYGDVNRWDMMWLGHCGADFPRADENGWAPTGRVIIEKDETVPEQQHLDREWGDGDWIHDYDAHTRIVSRTRGGTCTHAYAVTQQGARKLLYELGLKSFPAALDLILRDFCDGTGGRPLATCLQVQPTLFNQHRPVGSAAAGSNIQDHEGYNDFAHTVNVRWSTRVNFPKLVAGQTDYTDSLRDGEDRPYR